MMSNFPIDEFIFLRCNVDIEQVYSSKKHTHQKNTRTKKTHTPKKHTPKKTKKTEQMY